MIAIELNRRMTFQNYKMVLNKTAIDINDSQTFYSLK